MRLPATTGCDDVGRGGGTYGRTSWEGHSTNQAPSEGLPVFFLRHEHLPQTVMQTGTTGTDRLTVV